MTAANTGIAVAAALGSAAAFGVASALQHAQTAHVTRRSAADPRLIVSLLARPVWALGVAGDGVGLGLQILALRHGQVVLVQPLLVAGLPVAVIVSALMRRTAVPARDVWGVLLCWSGLILLGPAASSHDLGGRGRPAAWLAAAVLLALCVGGLLLLAHLRPAAAPAAVGMAAGVAAGTGAVLLAVCAADLLHPARLLATPAPYAAAGAGALAFLLTQSAFQTGALAAPLSALTVSEPIVAVLLAVTVLHERFSGGLLAAAMALLGSLLAVGGVLTLVRTKVLAPDPDLGPPAPS